MYSFTGLLFSVFLLLGSLAQGEIQPKKTDYCEPLVSSEVSRSDGQAESSASFEVLPTSEPITISQSFTKARVEVLGAGVHGNVGTQIPVGVFLSVCVKVTNLADVDFVHGGVYGLMQSSPSEVTNIHKIATAVANGTPEIEAAETFKDATSDMYPTPEINPRGTAELVLIFDIDPDDANVYLTESLTESVPGVSKGVFIPTSETQVQAALIEKGDQPASESSVSARQPSSSYGQVTQFGVDTLIHVGMPKYWLNFSEGVEVRTQIGGVYPQNGQFLVIWFDQQSQDGTPLRMGNFQLKASAGPDGRTRTVPLSESGTEALIVTEYTWNPNVMDSSTRYRTGIAFDISPEETHFVLEYDLGTSNEPWGPRKPVEIEFTA